MWITKKKHTQTQGELIQELLHLTGEVDTLHETLNSIKAITGNDAVIALCDAALAFQQPDRRTQPEGPNTIAWARTIRTRSAQGIWGRDPK